MKPIVISLLMILVLFISCKKSDPPTGHNGADNNSVQLTITDSSYIPSSFIWVYKWQLVNNTTKQLHKVRIKSFSTDSSGHYVPKERGYWYYQPFQNCPSGDATMFPLILPIVDTAKFQTTSYIYKLETYGRWDSATAQQQLLIIR